MADIEHMIRDSGLKKTWIAGQLDIEQTRFSNMLYGRKPFPDDKVAKLAGLLRRSVREVREAIAALSGGGG